MQKVTKRELYKATIVKEKETTEVVSFYKR